MEHYYDIFPIVPYKIGVEIRTNCTQSGANIFQVSLAPIARPSKRRRSFFLPYSRSPFPAEHESTLYRWPRLSECLSIVPRIDFHQPVPIHLVHEFRIIFRKTLLLKAPLCQLLDAIGMHGSY